MTVRSGWTIRASLCPISPSPKCAPRLLEVAELEGRHEVALAYLKQERIELETAVRVFDRFHDRPDFSDLLPSAKADEPEVRKPEGIPTMPEMIMGALAEAAIDTGQWMEPKEIVSVIRRRWWPDAPSTSVGPIAWRMAKEGRIKKQGGVYTVLANEAPSAADISDLTEISESEAQRETAERAREDHSAVDPFS